MASNARLRKVCLALPHAEERETWEIPTFRIRDKIFCMQSEHDERIALVCKAPPGSQAVLVGSDKTRFFVPAYVGRKGWIGMWLDRGVDWGEVAKIVGRSFEMTAPKKLLAGMGSGKTASSEAASAKRAESGPVRRRKS